MKRELLTVAVSFLLVVAMAVLANIDAITPERYVWGRIRIQERGIYAEVYTTVKGSDCIPTLWNGGIATTTADLSAIHLYDIADIVTLDGGHYVLECVEIIPCIRVGGCLVGWQGVIRTKGDIILYDAYKAYRFTRL